MNRPSLHICLVRQALWLVSLLALVPASAAQLRLPGMGDEIELRARQQRAEGKVFYADGDVEMRYGKLRLRADHVAYNSESRQAVANGHVQFDFDSQHIEAQEARYDLRTGRGTFRRVRATLRVRRAPNPNVLLSDNPLLVEAEEIERLDELTYTIRRAWVTVCPPDRPLWKFYAARATLFVDRSVRLDHAAFRLLYLPVLYLPRASLPAGRKLRQSGFLLPHFANSSRKGFVAGDSFYWAPVDWADLTAGAEFLSRRGWAQIAELRARPWENIRVASNYFAVNDRGLIGPSGIRVPQKGHQAHFELDAQLPGNWRAAADINQLTSLSFRLAFAETFNEAANAEIRTTAFVTHHIRGFSLNFSTLNYKNFLSAAPETAVVLRASPGVRFSSVDQGPWNRWPLYFGFHVSAEAVHRSDPLKQTPAAVQRTEFAPRVTLPVRWGPWFGVVPSFRLRATRYGAQLDDLSGAVVGRALRRTTAELAVDVRPPAFERLWQGGSRRWKHAVEPGLIYRYTAGVDRFGRFLRFDENDTLTDTHELEYWVTQHVYFRAGSGSARELLSWRVGQKYYLDPTFGGAILPGRRNSFAALYSITPFAFADGARRFSPLVSDLRVRLDERYDAQFRFDYDTRRGKITAVGTLINVRPYRESFITLAHFATRASDLLQPRFHQIRALVGYGDINRRGLNAMFGFSFDVREAFSQNQVVQVSWNGSCCGIGIEFRRLALGPLRSENQFRVALMIANLGTFGNLRRQEKIF